ncbi:uncharacterized protein LOC111036533 isoform X2 [Myzus persicae]|uniref:uncharacterized protein LOC111036533 isoform X2 n=1 Tax=Myzus persicae TaxID=13164 RepID=UPI000B934810|nr:uncharacterized protein LOC111036533 isoform X2 [Myzus persicae]
MIAKSVTVLILGIFVIDGSAADSIFIEYKSHTDYYDVTAIYKTQSVYNTTGEEGNSFNNSRCSGCKDVEIHLRTNAIGMPIEFDGVILSSDKKSLEFIADYKYPTNILTRNKIEYNVKEWVISPFIMSNNAEIPKFSEYNLLLWRANNNEESFKIRWKQRNTIQQCISVSYILNDVSKCTFTMILIDEDSPNKQIIGSNNIKESSQSELKTILFKNNNWLYENKTYSLNCKLQKKSLRVKKPNANPSYFYDTYETVYVKGCEIGIKRIAQCTDDNDDIEYNNEEIFTITAKELQNTPSATSLTFNVYPFGKTSVYTPRNKSLPSSTCFNGGFEHKDGCVCPVGFKGDNCEQECMNGTYGANCEQTCSSGCSSKSCDIYTGVCTEGCKTSYILPYCITKYPWLKRPPQLESWDVIGSLMLKIDLNSENIDGSKNMKSEYYQIVFKIATDESEFQYPEIKEIGQQKSVIEIIDNLQQGISYTFGVILISEDGNYNTEDIKTVNYSTKCILPRNTNYNVNLTSGTDYINVTWNKLSDQNEGNCKITEYLLELKLDRAAIKQQSYSEKVKSNDNYGHIFENLLPGEKYTVQAIAILATGQTKPLNISYVYTKPRGFIQMKNIKTKIFNNQSLLLTWDIDEKYEISLNYIVKYKVNKYFSCSHRVVTNNWTSLIVNNQTRQEILDLIPNTQYVLKVEPKITDYTYNDNENIIFVKTPISSPQLIPIMNVENDSCITNQTANFNWMINMTECSKLNGFFQGYHVILKNIFEGTQVAKSTKQNSVIFDELKPDTNYELQVYVLTNHGYNSNQGLFIPFKTKSKFLDPAVEELIVYKKNLIHKLIGIRWSFPDNYIINGFIVIAINKNSTNNTKKITVKPERCIAWPKFYCTTFEDLIPNNQYTIEVKAKSQDYPTGGLPASVVSDFSEGFSDTPENLRAINVSSVHILVEWDIPWVFNGVLKSFIVSTEEISSKDIAKVHNNKSEVEIQVTEEIPTYNYTIYNLKPNTTYSIGVLSKTSSNDKINKIQVTTLPTPTEI